MTQHSIFKFFKACALIVPFLWAPNTKAFDYFGNPTDINGALKQSVTLAKMHLATDLGALGVRYLVSQGVVPQSAETPFEYLRMISLGLSVGYSASTFWKCYKTRDTNPAHQHRSNAWKLFLLSAAHAAGDVIELPAHLGLIPQTFFNSRLAPAGAGVMAVLIMLLTGDIDASENGNHD